MEGKGLSWAFSDVQCLYLVLVVHAGVSFPQAIQPGTAVPDPSFKKGKEGLGSYMLVSFTSSRTFSGI